MSRLDKIRRAMEARDLTKRIGSGVPFRGPHLRPSKAMRELRLSDAQLAALRSLGTSLLSERGHYAVDALRRPEREKVVARSKWDERVTVVYYRQQWDGSQFEEPIPLDERLEAADAPRLAELVRFLRK